MTAQMLWVRKWHQGESGGDCEKENDKHYEDWNGAEVSCSIYRIYAIL